MSSAAAALRFYAATDVGRVRDHNEDNFLVDKKLGLFVVCDGMGGHAAGEVASAIAVRTVHEELKREQDRLLAYGMADVEETGGQAGTRRAEVLGLMEQAVQMACARVHQEAQQDETKRGMGTTLSALLLLGHQGYIAHVGDSRVYLLRAGRAQQITEDHTVYNELVKRGRLTREQIERVAQKNAITRAVGVYERVDVDTLFVEALTADAFVLCSDGLHGYLQSPDELAQIVQAPVSSDACTRALIEMANERGGKDNVTAVVAQLGGEAVIDARAQRLALKREVVAQMPLFARLTARELLRILQICDVRFYAADQVVLKEGDQGDELFIVLSGSVRVLRGEATLTTLGKGQHFGEMALIRNTPRSATVTAAQNAELIAIRRADFFDILRTESELAVKMLWEFLNVLAHRLDTTSGELRDARAELSGEPSIEIFPEVDEAGPPTT
jgi:serine/threonine protein phosphatase PrpC